MLADREPLVPPHPAFGHLLPDEETGAPLGSVRVNGASRIWNTGSFQESLVLADREPLVPPHSAFGHLLPDGEKGDSVGLYSRDGYSVA